MIPEQVLGTKTILMKPLITGSVIFLIGIFSFFGLKKFNSYPVFYDHNGQLTGNQVKIWADTTTPTTGTGFSIDISSAGFSVIKSATVTAQNNTAAIGSMPIVVIKSVTTTAIVVNIMEQNSATTTILGITVLSGSPLQLATTTTGFLLNVKVEGF